MNICDRESTKEKTFVSGRLYETPNIGVSIYCSYYKTFVELKDGSTRTNSEYLDWIDVTDQYCLKKV